MLTSLTKRLVAATLQLAGRKWRCLAKRRLVLIGAVALMLGAAPLVDAGSVAYGQDRMEQRAPSGQGNENLPAWAEPSTEGPSNRGRVSDQQQPSVGEGQRKDFNPDEPVPLGGLEWLILIGVGYGLVRLRSEE